jgi:large subunit ribosomal protein L13
VKVAALLRGKQEKYFLANFDLGNYVVLVNADKVRFTGNKLNDKYYYNHSGYPGNLRKQMKRLFIFPTQAHNLQAQEKDFIKINI